MRVFWRAPPLPRSDLLHKGVFPDAASSRCGSIAVASQGLLLQMQMPDPGSPCCSASPAPIRPR
eukprot:7045761-Alexandrium_andersonii.AAC.1